MQYFREVNSSHSWFVIGGFRSILLAFGMTIMIMIDGSVKRNREFGFKLQSSRVIEKRYNKTQSLVCIMQIEYVQNW